MTAPLLETNDARVDVGGAPALDGLSLRTSGDHLLVLGAARALFEAASGVRKPSRGAVLVRGEAATLTLRKARVAGAPLDPAMPVAWTPRAYVTWSARLAGREARLTKELAAESLERLKMTALGDTPLGKVAPHARRATVLAAAIATGAPVVMVEDPTAGLPDAVAREFARIITSALADRAWVVFAPRIALASPIALEADEAVVVSGSQPLAQGAPAEIAARERTYGVKVHGAVEELARAAEARGAKVTRGQSELTVDLGESLSTRELMGMALEVKAVIVELSPLSSALG